MNHLQAGPFELRWPDTLRSEAYESAPSYYGVVFHVGDYCYDVVVNSYLGLRLIITRTDVLGHFQDIPFHLGTVGLLPKDIEVHITPR